MAAFPGRGGALMCGIGGMILERDAPPPDPAVLGLLAAALAHRGPDGSGQAVSGNVALLHARLAIIDVAGGDQPLHAGQASLIANGEIYNYRELRPTLPEANFATESDCETPLHLWLRQGDAYAAPLRGMYAIAVHGRADRTLTLSRDPFGIKPLYIAAIPRGLAFASEPQALLATGLVARTVRPAARRELLQMQFTTGAETIFEGITRLLPGETLTCTDGRAVHRSRLAALPEGPPRMTGEAAALAALDVALAESVALHQRSDVPFGLFLSGGVDSACLLAQMARNGRVHAFTAGFDVPGAPDEREQAATLAAAVGARHESIEITQDMVWRHLPAIVAAMDDPACDYAIIPTWFLARHAARSVKVVLSGEGGDELFAGYGRYRSAIRPFWMGGRAMRRHGTFHGLGFDGPAFDGWRDGMTVAEAAAALPGRTRLQAAQATDMQDWLPHDLLLKLDRCLMAHGVEGRTPFLDRGMAELAYALPDALKIARGRGKYLLRAWLENALPAARPFAPKQGFTVPVGAWIAERGEALGKLVAAQPGVMEFAAPDKVRALFRDCGGKHRGFAAWTLLFYALWHQAHLRRVPVEGGTMEVLAA